MLVFIFAIIGLCFIIGLLSMLADLENSAIECVIGIVGIFVLYGLVTGAVNLFFWLGYQIGPGYAILVIILLIVCPILLFYFYDNKSNRNNGNVILKQNKNFDKEKYEKEYKERNKRFDYNYKYSSPKYESTLDFKICPKCGRKVGKDSNYCSYCNYKFN